jgi:signal transduction histidine kinase/DNA-binding response OmpR family regulator
MNILIAEDDYISRNLLQKMLKAMGYSVLTAEDGREAWEIYRKNNVKMVVTDWMMPNMDGLMLCEKIRAAGKRNYTYIIILTAKDSKGDLVEVFNSGADDYIPKPFEYEELKARLKTGRRILQLEDEHNEFKNILIESRNKLRIVLDCLQEKIVALDDERNIVSANKAFLADIGRSFSDVMGIPFLDHATGSNLLGCDPKIESFMAKVFGSGKIQSYLDKSAGQKGDVRYKEISCLPVKNDAGVVFQVVIVENDITDDKLKSEKINSLNTELEQALDQIKVKNKELKNTQSQIVQSEKLASIGQLAAGVAHEINNPTGFVSSNLKSLLDYQNDINKLLTEYRKLLNSLEDNAAVKNRPSSIAQQIGEIAELETEIDIDFIQEDIQDLLQDCREGTERIKKIVLDLKDFAHPGDDDLKLADINQGIESTLNVIANEIKYKATVVKDFGKLPMVKCYPQQLNQVFMNILVNAAQAIQTQGKIQIQTRHSNGYVEVKISDTGSGISKENLSKIFDPFFTTKDVGKGTGLGMNIAYNIIKEHNGTIEVESAVDKGTTFSIQLPDEENADPLHAE